MEFKKDPVQFVIDNNDEVKELVDQLDGTENQQALQSEIRDTISSAIGMPEKSPSLIACNMVNFVIEFTSSGASVLI
jgi:hypothetical protein